LRQAKLAIKNKQIVSLYLKKINQEIGYGVYANQSLKKGQIIGEYTGEMISNSDFKKLSEQNKRKDYAWAVGPVRKKTGWFGKIFSFSLNREQVVIDGYALGNETRFVNHSY